MKLYDYFRSSASYRVRIVLNYKNIDYTKQEVHLVNNGGEQHSEDYQKINIQKLVPSLGINSAIHSNNNAILTQSLAIIEYLEELYPSPSILPKDSFLRAQARSMAYIIACDTHPLNNLRVLNYLKSSFDISEDEKTTWYHHWLAKGFTSYEHYAANYSKNGHYSVGSELSIADICLIPQVYNALRFELPMFDYPMINKIYNNCLELECFKNTAP